jgi:hypothetical protein
MTADIFLLLSTQCQRVTSSRESYFDVFVAYSGQLRGDLDMLWASAMSTMGL